MQSSLTTSTSIQPGVHPSSIPSRFARLLDVAILAKSLADEGEDRVNTQNWQEVRQEHLAAFEDWLCLGLQEKEADFRLCAASQGRSAASLLLSLSRPQNHNDLLPVGAVQLQRDLFVMELEVLFLVL